MKRGRRDHNRHRDPLSEYGRAHVAGSDSGQDAVVKLQLFPTSAVLAERDFIQGSAFIVIEDILRQLGPRCARIIGDVKEQLGIHQSDLSEQFSSARMPIYILAASYCFRPSRHSHLEGRALASPSTRRVPLLSGGAIVRHLKCKSSNYKPLIPKN